MPVNALNKNINQQKTLFISQAVSLTKDQDFKNGRKT